MTTIGTKIATTITGHDSMFSQTSPGPGRPRTMQRETMVVLGFVLEKLYREIEDDDKDEDESGQRRSSTT